MFSLNFVKPRRKKVAKVVDIDVKQRIAELSEADLLTSADAYFSGFSSDSIQYKKPFSDPEQAVHLTQHLGLLLQAADLFRGARVLDFGCGTGWLSLGLAQMGCDVIGVDVAPKALKLADKLKTTRRVASDGRMEFHAYDGQRLPMTDASVDRIVCFDAFHHVRDQAATLREFARVLRDGGRIAFIEPGPEHSKTRASQSEMALFNVIENDINVSDVAALAQAAGLGVPEVLVQFQQPLQIGLKDFERWSRTGLPVRRAHAMLQTLVNQISDTQCFFIPKGRPTLDSRQAKGLGAELRLLQTQPDTLAGRPALQFRVLLRNTGPGLWLTRPGVGQVRLGAQVFSANGSLIDLDYARFDLPPTPLSAGQELELEGVVLLPEPANTVLKLDVVAENVAWLGPLGKLSPLVLR